MRSVLVAALVLLLPCPAGAWQAKVVRVIDGDSLVVSERGRQVAVELYGVDCPEPGQPYAKSARNFTADMLSKRTVEVQVLENNQDGSVLALVTDFHEGVNLNQELVRNGLAWVVRDHCAGAHLRTLDGAGGRGPLRTPGALEEGRSPAALGVPPVRFAALALALVLALPLPARAWQAQVVFVHNDVSMTVKARNRDSAHVVLYGLDCPQRDEKFAGLAATYLRDTVLDKFVEVEPQRSVPGNTVVAHVYLIDELTCLNEDLVTEGLCTVSPMGCRDRICHRWLEKERLARELGAGMWARPVGKPIPRDEVPRQ